MKKIKLGIIGAGRIGKLHAENVLRRIPELELRTITDPFLDENWAKNAGILHFGKDAELIFSDPEIEAVLICSPASCHVQQMIAAARAGKHIFCEKPIATDIAEIKKAIAAVKKADVKCQIGFNRRFDANFAKIAENVREGKIGQPHLVRITSHDPELPSTDYIANSGGLFMDMSIHDFDMARFLAGSEVVEVFARGDVLINPDVAKHNDIDTAIIQCRFANGALGVIYNSRQAVYGYDQRVEVFGSLGKTHAVNQTPTRTVLSTDDGVMHDKPLYFFLDRYQDSYLAELRAFYQCIVDDKPSPVSANDGLMPVLIAQAAAKSYREKHPVSLGEIDG